MKPMNRARRIRAALNAKPALPARGHVQQRPVVFAHRATRRAKTRDGQFRAALAE